MKKKCIIGFDFGTTSLSAVVLNIQTTKIERVLSYNTHAYIQFEDNFRMEQSLEKLTRLFEKTINEIKSLPGIEIMGYGFTGQMHGIIGLSEKGKAVTNLVTWQDRSGDIEHSNGLTLLQELRSLTHVDTLVNGYGIVTLYKWIKYDKRMDIHSFCTVSDYFARMLVGNVGSSKMTPSMAHSIGLYDLHTDKWQTDIINHIGLGGISFPEIDLESQIIGYEESNGVKIPIVGSIGDNQASFIGSVLNTKETILLNVGTGTQLSFLIEKDNLGKYKKHIDGFETQIRPYNNECYLLATSFVNGGSVYKSLFNFFKDIAYNMLGLQTFDQNLLWVQMMEMGRSAMNNQTLPDVMPLLEGQRKDPSTGATISNLHTSNFTAGNFVAAFLEGMAKYYKTGLFPELEDSILYICGSGNGLKRNALFCEIIESTFGYPLSLTPFNEEAALGAALNACKEIGIIKSEQECIHFLSELSHPA